MCSYCLKKQSSLSFLAGISFRSLAYDPELARSWSRKCIDHWGTPILYGSQKGSQELRTDRSINWSYR